MIYLLKFPDNTEMEIDSKVTIYSGDIVIMNSTERFRAGTPEHCIDEEKSDLHSTTVYLTRIADHGSSDPAPK